MITRRKLLQRIGLGVLAAPVAVVLGPEAVKRPTAAWVGGFELTPDGEVRLIEMERGRWAEDWVLVD